MSHLHGDLDLLGGVQALGKMLQADAPVGVGEGVAAPAGPGRRGVAVISHVWQPAVETASHRERVCPGTRLGGGGGLQVGWCLSQDRAGGE